jgi:hypothetical protein
MAKKILTRAEFARAAPVSKAAVTKWLAGPGAPAAAGDGVDIEHPAAVTFLAKHRARAGRAAAAPTPSPVLAPAAPAAPPASRKGARARQPEPTPPPAPLEVAAPLKRGAPPPELDAAGYAPELDSLTLGEIVRRFGTMPQFADHLNACAKIETTRKTWLDNCVTEGKLIRRELVQTHLIGIIDGVFKRLLSDTARTIVLRLTSHAKAGGSVEDGEKIAVDLLSSQLDPVKQTAARVLRNA